MKSLATSRFSIALLVSFFVTISTSLAFRGAGTNGFNAGEGNQDPSQKDGNGNDNDDCDDEAGDPIELASGEFKQLRTDLVLPGLREPLRISFHYRSQRMYNGRWGFGWFFGDEQRLFVKGNGDVLWRIASGSQQTFVKSGSLFISPSGYHNTLTKLGNGSYELKIKNGIRYLFSAEGLLTSHIDRAGNATNYFYETGAGGTKIKSPVAGQNGTIIAMDYRLTQISGTLGKNVYFQYYGTGDGSKNGRLKQVVDDYGRTVQYDYNGVGDLISVTSPITSYEDPSGNLLTQGRVTLYSYSSGFRLNKPGAPEHVLDHNLLTITDDKEQIYLVNHYDENDRVWKQEHDGGITTLEYFLTGGQIHRTDETDANGVLRRHYYAEGRLARLEITPASIVHPSVSYPLNYFYSYNSCCSELSEVQNPQNNGVEIGYDPSGNVIEERRKTNIFAANHPEDIVTSYTYTTLDNQVKTMTDPLGKVTTYFYDYEEATLGDLNGDGITNQNAGNVVKIQYPNVIQADGTAQTNIAAKFWYNSSGQRIREIAPEGNAVQYIYYPSGNPSFGLLQKKVIDPGGLNLTTTFTYDSMAHLASIQDARGNTSYFVYNALGEMTEMSAPLNAAVRQVFDGNGNLVKREIQNADAAGNILSPQWITTRFEYDSWDHLLARIEDVESGKGGLLTRTTSYSYDPVGNLQTMTSPEANITRYDYDERNEVWKTTRGLGTEDEAVEIFHPDSNGNLTQRIDGNGKVSAMSYDLFDRLTSITDPESHRIETDYNKKSEILERRVINSGGSTLTRTQFVWDELGRRKKQIAINTQAAGQNEAQIFYDKNSRVSKTRTPRGFFTLFGYDNANRLATSTDPIGNSRVLSYDGNGNLQNLIETEIVPNAANEIYQTLFGYDALNRLQESRRFDRLNGAHQLVTNFGYDSRGNLRERIDPNGRLTRMDYDLASRLRSQIEDANGLSIETQWNFDLDNRLVLLRDADSRETIYSYDALGRRRTISYASGPGESFTYDDADNLKTHTAQDGVVTTYNYFDNNQLKDRSAGGLREEFTWNGLRLPLTAKVLVDSAQSSLVSFTYDGYGRVQNEAQDGYTAVHGYDADNNMNSLNYPGSSLLSLTLGYDSLDRLNSVMAGANTVGSYTFAGRSRVHTRTSNLTQTHQWDGLRRVSRITTGSVVDFGYNYDDLDRRSYEQRFHQGGRGDVYDYDSASRLKQVWYGASNPPSGPTGYTTHFQATLDPLENRLSTSTNGALTNYNTPDALHRYTSVGAVSRVYDLKGNLKDDGSYLFDYDAWNRLTRVKLKSNNAELSRYEYDAMGRRARKIEGTKISKYTYSGPRLLRRFEDPGSGTFSLKESYLYGAGLDELLAMDSGDQRYFVHQDALGSTAAITGSGGGVVERYRYDAYGNPTVTDSSGTPIVGANGLPKSSINNELWFAGARFDQESGYYHMRARQYEPRTGRFTSRDPLGYVDGPNPYSYVNSDPVNWVDPWGLAKNQGDQNNGLTPKPRRKPRRPTPWTKDDWIPSLRHPGKKIYLGDADALIREDTGFNPNAVYPDPWRPPEWLTLDNLFDFGGGFVPGVGEVQDINTVFGSDSTLLDRGIGSGSLLLSLVTGGFGPNFGSAGKRLGKELSEELADDAAKAGRNCNKLKPHPDATGPHSSFRRDPVTNEINHYETFTPQTNPKNPNPWQSVKRYDGTGDPHFNKKLGREIPAPHVHDPNFPGGVRPPIPDEIP